MFPRKKVNEHTTHCSSSLPQRRVGDVHQPRAYTGQGKHYLPQRRSTLAEDDGDGALAVVTSHHLFRQKGAYHPSVCMGLNS